MAATRALVRAAAPGRVAAFEVTAFGAAACAPRAGAEPAPVAIWKR